MAIRYTWFIFNIVLEGQAVWTNSESYFLLCSLEIHHHFTQQPEKREQGNEGGEGRGGCWSRGI